MNEAEKEAALLAVRSNAGLAAVNEAMVLKAVYESGLHQYAPGVLRTSWKDGIDIDVPCPALVNFANKICKAANVI